MLAAMPDHMGAATKAHHECEHSGKKNKVQEVFCHAAAFVGLMRYRPTAYTAPMDITAICPMRLANSQNAALNPALSVR